MGFNIQLKSKKLAETKRINDLEKKYKENIYKPTEKEFIATSVNVTKRVVKEFDNTQIVKHHIYPYPFGL
mgnify:CR=1 FL=1